MRHRFYVVFRDVHGAAAFEAEVTDLRAICQDAVFRAVCAGTRRNDGTWADIELKPLWRERNLAGISVAVGDAVRSYGLAVFADQAMELLLTRHSREKNDEETRWTGTITVRHSRVVVS